MARKSRNIEVAVLEDLEFSKEATGGAIIKFKDIKIGLAITNKQLLAAKEQNKRYIKALCFLLGDD